MSRQCNNSCVTLAPNWRPIFRPFIAAGGFRMKTAAPAFRVPKGVRSGLLGLLFAIAPAALLLGCGSSISGFSGGGPPPPQNGTVVLLLTSTANDEPAVFGIGIDSVQLVDQAGKAV